MEAGVLILQLLAMVPARLDVFDIQAISNTTSVLAKSSRFLISLGGDQWSQSQTESLMSQLLSAAQYKLDMGTPQNISNVLWSCASLGTVPDRDWMALFYDAVDRTYQDFNAQDVSNTLWAFAKLTERAAADKTNQEKEKREDAPERSDVVQDLLSSEEEEEAKEALRRRRPFSVPSAIISKILQAAYPILPTLSPQHLANCTWALARMGFTPTQAWMKALESAASAKLRSSNIQSEQANREGLGGEGNRFSSPLRGGGFSPKELAGMGWGLSRLRGQYPTSEFIEAFLRASYLELPKMRAGEVAQVLLALGTMRVKPPGGWLTSFIVAATRCLPQFNPQVRNLGQTSRQISHAFKPH